MFKSIFAAALSVSTLSASASVTYDVYIIAGQSNADGRGLASDLPAGSPLALPQNDTLISYLNPADPSDVGDVDLTSNGFVTLEPGFSRAPGEDRTAGVPSGVDYFGAELSFAASISEATGSDNPVALIKVTQGGTNLRSNWRAGGPVGGGDPGFLYTALIDHVTDSLSELNQGGNTANLSGFLWHQGESDSNTGPANAYADRITDLINGVRTEFDTPDLPFVLGELSQERSNSTLFNSNINAFVDSGVVDNLGLVSSEGLQVIGDGDTTHFDAVGQVELGQRYAAALGELIPDPLSTLIGDYNGDGFVGQADLDLVLLNFGNSQLPEGFNPAALPNGPTFDGLIGQNELDAVLLSFGGSNAPNLTAIPEPASLAMLSLGGWLLSGRRRR